MGPAPLNCTRQLTVINNWAVVKNEDKFEAKFLCFCRQAVWCDATNCQIFIAVQWLVMDSVLSVAKIFCFGNSSWSRRVSTRANSGGKLHNSCRRLSCDIGFAILGCQTLVFSSGVLLNFFLRLGNFKTQYRITRKEGSMCISNCLQLNSLEMLMFPYPPFWTELPEYTGFSCF